MRSPSEGLSPPSFPLPTAATVLNEQSSSSSAAPGKYGHSTKTKTFHPGTAGTMVRPLWAHRVQMVQARAYPNTGQFGSLWTSAGQGEHTHVRRGTGHSRAEEATAQGSQSWRG